jgi:hypothetical protein
MVAKGKQNTSSQDIIPDINAYYNKLILEIDRFRSRRNSSSIIGIFANITEKGLDQALATTELNSIFPQESRCNAFYRMLGLPVVAPNGELYSPGFNPDANRDAAERQRQLTIANALLQEIGPVLNSRELYPKNMAAIFQQQNEFASATAVSSIYVRNFAKQFKSGLNPLDKDLQTFQIPDRQEFVNTKFAKDNLDSLLPSEHILKPFVTDPRIEWTVAPAANRICVPFLTDKSKTQLSKGQFLKRPYIEQVLRTRISEANTIAVSATQPASGQYLRDLIASIQSNKAIVDQTAIETLSNPLNTLQKSELAVFEKFVRILESFISELVKSINQIGRIGIEINWKPIPNINGPEFGSELNTPNGSDDKNNNQIENEILYAELMNVISQTTLTEDSVVDLGEFAFSDSDYTPLSTTQHNYDWYDKQLKVKTNRRNELGNKANDLLKRIEIITGEFSGLGLLDIIAIQATFWTISPEALLGLIDGPARDRMTKDKKLSTTGITPKSGVTALLEFEKKLSGIYILMDTFYQNIIDANGVNNQ